MAQDPSMNPSAPQNSKDLTSLTEKLGIGLDEADTLVSDIIPILKRKFNLLNGKSSSAAPGDKNNIRIILDREVPKVFSNYGLATLKNNKAVLIFVAKNISPDITDLRAKQLVDVQISQTAKLLADELAAQLGIRSTNIHEFRSKIIPRLKKHTKTMYQKRLESQDPNNDVAEFKQFVIDNVFIDEFENHPFIRSATDENNRAILLPKAKKIALKMISAWMNEAAAK
jgi:hypothetical protein